MLFTIIRNRLFSTILLFFCKMMLKITSRIVSHAFPGFAFCESLDKFKGAEAIFQTAIYHHQTKQINENMEPHDLITTVVKNQQLRRFFLSDKIVSVLKGMKQEEKIKAQVAQQLIGMFDPVKGINIQKYNYGRLQAGRNKNRLFPLNPKSSIMDFALKQIYSESFIKPKHFRTRYANQIIYIVGTTGTGKSCTFLTTKIIQDLKIRYLIKEGSTEKSIFLNNLKFFYFVSNTQTLDIMESIIQQVAFDFDYNKEIIKKLKHLANQDTLREFMKYVNHIYNKSIAKIRVVFFVDQINYLYDKQSMSFDTKEHIIKWRTIFRAVGSPMYLISSKNNFQTQLASSDPVGIIAGSFQRMNKIILDNFITAQDRLCYTFECLIFELEKSGIGRNNAIQIVSNIRDIPLLSHQSIQGSIKNIHQIRSKSIEDQIAKIKHILKNKNRDISQSRSNFKQLNQLYELNSLGQTKNESDYQQISNMIRNLLNFYLSKPSKVQIKAEIELINEQGQFNVLKIQYSAFSRLLWKYIIQKDKIKSLQNAPNLSLENLANSNYFFISDFAYENMNKQQNFVEKIYEQRLIFNLNQQGMAKLRNEISNIMAPQTIRAIKQFDTDLFNYIADNRGFLFENLICSLFERQQQIEVCFDNIGVSFFYLTQLQNKLDFNPQITSISGLSETVNIMLSSQKSCYIRTEDGSQKIDFVLSFFQDQKLTLILVDATVSLNKVEQKIKEFYFELMEKNMNFLHFIKECEKSQQVKSIRLCYYVLTPHKGYFDPKNSRRIQGSEKIEESPKDDFSKEKQRFIAKTSKITAIEHAKGHFTEDLKIIKKIRSKVNFLGEQINDVMEAMNKIDRRK